MQAFKSFNEMRNTPPESDGVRCKTYGYHEGSPLGGSEYFGKLVDDDDNGITQASTGNGYCWYKVDKYDLTPFHAGATENENDYQPFFQACVDMIQSYGIPVAGNYAGRVHDEFGYTYPLSEPIVVTLPIAFHTYGNLKYTGTTGFAIKFGNLSGWSNGYDIIIKNLYSSGPSFPTTVDENGSSGILIQNMTFSQFKLGSCYGFSNVALDLDCAGIGDFQQIVQHNRFDLCQIVNNGIGVRLRSLDAATSSVQANYFFSQNVYQNAKNFSIDEGNYFASTSNTIHLNAMDNSKIYGMHMNSKWNNVYIGFTGDDPTDASNIAPSVVMGPNSESNRIRIGNNYSTSVRVTYGGVNNFIDTAPPPSSQLPAYGVVVTDGAVQQNTYGVTANLTGVISFNGVSNVKIYVGSDGVNPAEIYTMQGSSGAIPVSIIVPNGWYYRVWVQGPNSASISKFSAIESV